MTAAVSRFYVYVYFRLDGSPCYVGKGSGHRWRTHIGKCRNPALRRIIEAASGELPVVKIREGMTEDEAFELEAALIRAIGRKPIGRLVNMSDGGEGASGRKMKPETVAKLAALSRGRKKSPETIERHAAQLRGRPVSEAKRLALVAARKGYIASPETLQRMSDARRGKPWTEAQKASARQNWKHTEQSRAKIGDALRGKKQDPEFAARRIKASLLARQNEDVRAKASASVKASWVKRRARIAMLKHVDSVAGPDLTGVPQ